MKSLISDINAKLERHGFAIHTHPKGYKVYRKGVIIANYRIRCGKYLPETFKSIRAALDGIVQSIQTKP